MHIKSLVWPRQSHRFRSSCGPASFILALICMRAAGRIPNDDHHDEYARRAEPDTWLTWHVKSVLHPCRPEPPQDASSKKTPSSVAPPCTCAGQASQFHTRSRMHARTREPRGSRGGGGGGRNSVKSWRSAGDQVTRVWGQSPSATLGACALSRIRRLAGRSIVARASRQRSGADAPALK